MIAAPKRLTPLLLAAGLVVCLAPPFQAQTARPGFGVIGDSGSDEYRADDGRGGRFAATTLNWNELLSVYRGFNFGPWGRRPAPRRSGFEYNWARTGATIATLIAEGQHLGLARQIWEGKVQYAAVMIGVNDFAPWNGTYRAIYSGALSGQALNDTIDRHASNLEHILDTVLAARPVKLVMANIPDRGGSPVTIAAFPDPAKRRLVTNAIVELNDRIQTMTRTRPVVLIDMYNWGNRLLSQVGADGNLVIGGAAIALLTNGDEPHHLILGDNEHGGTVAEGLLANMFIDHWNLYGLGATPFTDAEILSHAGISASPPSR
jgi:hypothetical protein